MNVGTGGDANLDGKINVDDYGINDFNLGIQGTPFPTGSSAGSLGSVSAVPEPANAAALLGLLSAAMTQPVRRTRRVR